MKQFRVVVMVVLAGLLVVACGGGDKGSSGSDATAADRGAAAGVGKVDPAGVFRFADFYAPNALDPHKAADSIQGIVLFPVYDRLVHLSPDGELVPGLATEWKFSADGLSLEMKLREGVTFHDGETFDAAAVKANIERGKTLEGSAVAAELAVVTSVEVVDDHTVRFVLSSPKASLIGVLSDRHGAMISPAAFDNPDLDTHPVGAGMYRLVEFSPGVRIVYERFKDYWDPDAVKAQRLEYLIMPDEQTRLNGLETGAVDAARLSPALADQAKQAGLIVTEKPTTGSMTVYTNRSAAPLSDQRVRQALSYAIDRDAIVEGIRFGKADASPQPFPKGVPGHVDALENAYAYDPAKALKLLKEAGYADGFSFELMTTTVPEVVAIGEALQAQWAKIGVHVTIRSADPAQYNEIFFVNKQAPMAVGVWGGRPVPLMTVAARWLPTSFLNTGKVSSDKLTELYAQAARTIDQADQTALLEQISKEIVEQAFDPILFHDHEILATTDKVVGMTTYVSGKPEFRGVGVTG